MAIFDTFDGVADQPVSSRAGWLKHRAASPELVSTTGDGAVKLAVYTTGYPVIVVHDTGSPNQYAECVIGSDAIGKMRIGLRLLVCRQVIDAVSVGINVIYNSTYDTLYLRNNDTTIVENSAIGVRLVAGDTLRLEVQDTTAYVYRNGVQVLTGTIPAGTSTYAGFGGNADSAINPLITSFSAGALAPADSEAPTFTGSITTSTVTSSTLTDNLPTAADNVSVVGYQGRLNGGAWVDLAGPTASWTGLTPLTSYNREYRAYDATPNYSTLLAVTTSTYREGASAGSILAVTGPQDGNPAGFLYALAGTVASDAWLSYRILSGPTPAGGVLSAQPNGAASYTGPTPATLTIQPEVNGADTPEAIVITLYDSGVAAVLSALSVSIQSARYIHATVTTDTAGDAYLVLTTSSSPPTPAQIIAGLDASGDPAVRAVSVTLAVGVNDQVSTFNVTTPGTYYVHVVQQGSPTSNVLSSSPTVVPTITRFATLTFRDKTGALLPGLRNLKWAWWDEYPPNLSAPPVISSDFGTTDDTTGVFTAGLAYTVLAAGDVGTLLVYTGNGIPGNTANKAFFGPVEVS